jgi:membrane protease YdiL (CAAX protease family)
MGPLLHAWDAWLLCLVLAGLVPFHGVLAYGRLKSGPDRLPTGTKLRLYATIVVMEWALVALTFAVLHHHGLTLGDVGQRLGNPALTLSAMLVGFLGLAAITALNARQIRRAEREELERSVERARKFVPVEPTEVAAFALVALTAGICEEILYRGWLVTFLGAFFGSVWIGVVVAAVLFGLGHAYQGWKGILATGILGVLFGAMFVAVKSLVPGQTLHAAIDIVNGVLAGGIVKRLAQEPTPSGPVQDSGPPSTDAGPPTAT